MSDLRETDPTVKTWWHLKDRIAELEAELEIAANEAYNSEVVETDMESIIIGGEYLSKEDWIASRLEYWAYCVAQAKEGK